MLVGLKQTPIGTVIYDQVSQVANEYHLLRGKVDQTYGLLMHLLLDAYSQNPTAESVTRLTAQLIQLRDAASAPMVPAAIAAPLFASPRPSSPPPTTPATRAPEPEGAPSNGANHTERRVNTAYRLHLDRKRDEIEKLQETLSQGIREAITQNREFGALLQIELGALKQADGEQEMENLRQILIGGIEELINGQHLLDTKLHQTGGYLGLIKADSQRLRDELHKVRLLSLTDEFTGLPNRRAFMRSLQDEIGRAQRYGTPLALVIIDLDEFKRINDVHGHNGGDEVLRCFATQVLTILRHHDMVARYGGEEFAVMLPNTAEIGAVAAIDKARQRAHDMVCHVGEKTIKLPTFSAGVALYQAHESPTDLIERADRALYAAKSFGRDRTEVAPAPAQTSSNPESQETS
jgi:diguanylate cyclase (GGDEF)-like protein